MGRKKDLTPIPALDTNLLPRHVTSGTVQRALAARGVDVDASFVLKVWYGMMRDSETIREIKEETALQAGRPIAELWIIE